MLVCRDSTLLEVSQASLLYDAMKRDTQALACGINKYRTCSMIDENRTSSMERT